MMKIRTSHRTFDILKMPVTMWVMLAAITTMAQDSLPAPSKVKWKLFADVYYSYDFNKPANHEKPFFLFNHKRHNEVNLNLGLVQASYCQTGVRAHLGLMAGTYAQYNYAEEPGLLRNVFQANAGVKLSRHHDLWLDAGIFPSHLGYESALSSENWTLTRSLMAENSPYYEAGAKLTFTANNAKWLMSALLLNGWQRIRRLDGNNTPAFGTQLTFRPNTKTTLNWSSFIGNDFPDVAKRWRYFNDFYAVLELSEKVGLTLAFDIGLEQTATGSNKMHPWYSPNVIWRLKVAKDWAIAARGEFYRDKYGVIVPAGTNSGFWLAGGSINVDKKVGENLWWRTEWRTLRSRDAIFSRNNVAVNGNTFLTTSFALSF